MKKFKLNAVAAIAASVAAGSVFAAPVNLDATTPAPVIVAKEIVATVAAPVTLDASAAASATDKFGLLSAVGYSLSAGEVRYVRVELANAKFASVGTVDSSATTTNAAIGAVNGVGTSVIYFSLTAVGGQSGVPATSTLTIPATIKIEGTASNVTATFSVYDQPSQAQAGGETGRIVNKANKPYISFAKSYQAKATAVGAVSNVEASPAFTAFETTETYARLAKDVAYGLADTVPFKADGNAVTLANLMSAATTGTKLVVTGDFAGAANANGTYTGTSVANAVFLSANTDCSTLDQVASAVTATSATFNVGATLVDTNSNLCYVPRVMDPKRAIAASTYTASLNAVSASASTYSVESTSIGALGEITRNGTELQSPLFQTTAGFVSRFFLTNTGSVDANVTVSLQGETGNTLTAGTTSFVIPKNGSLEIPAASILTSATGAPRATAVFSIARPSKQIQGVYQIVNQTSGAVSNIALQRPGTN